MAGTIKKITPNYSFRIPIFDAPGWGREVERNFDIVDAVLFAATGLGGIVGAWTNSTIYEQGERAVDQTDSTIWEVVVNHTSPATGTFEADRIANPGRWIAVTNSFNYKGAWVTATNYVVNDIVFEDYLWALVTKNFTSTTSLQDDIDDGNAVVLLDGTDIVDDATAAKVAAEAAQTAAAASQSAAATSATNASNSATAASGSASAAATSATNAGNSETAAAGSATTAGTAATNASNSAIAADASADAAAISETNAAASETAAAASAAAAAAISKVTIQTFTASGTWTKPAGCTHVEIEAVGGGGAGGGTGGAGSQAAAASGGSSGAAGHTEIIDVTAVASASVLIGAGGVAGALGPNNGGAGGATSIILNGVGYSWGGGPGGVGASPSASDRLSQLGGSATKTNVFGGGRRGQVGFASFGSTFAQGGYGADSPYGAGGAAPRLVAAGATNGNSASVTEYGAGGSGSVMVATASNTQGGDGAPGFMLIKEYYF